jgi:hypothetical protein
MASALMPSMGIFIWLTRPFALYKDNTFVLVQGMDVTYIFWMWEIGIYQEEEKSILVQISVKISDFGCT